MPSTKAKDAIAVRNPLVADDLFSDDFDIPAFVEALTGRPFPDRDSGEDAASDMLGDVASTDEADLLDHDAEGDFADAKPSHAGGGGGKGGGKGKKAKTDTSTDTGSTDTGDSGSGTSDPEPPQTYDPAPEPTPEPETAGSFGWLDSTTYVSGADTPAGFNIELEFHGGWTQTQKQVAANVAEHLSDLITGDMPSYGGIDDIRIKMYLQNIDGGGGTWGQGGWMTLRGDKTVAEGGVIIDSSDVGEALSRGMLDDLLQHEMLHAIGVGTTWTHQGLVSGGKFIGENAMAVYADQYGGSGGVPLDGSGAHWDEGALDKESVSQYVDAGEHVGDLTLAALEDMGYETVWDYAA